MKQRAKVQSKGFTEMYEFGAMWQKNQPELDGVQPGDIVLCGDWCFFRVLMARF